MHFKKIPWEFKIAVPAALLFCLFGILNNNIIGVLCGCVCSMMIGIYIGRMIYAVPFTKHPADYGFVAQDKMVQRLKDETDTHLNYAPGPGQTGDKDYRARLNKQEGAK
jgi:hypothetical protein